MRWLNCYRMRLVLVGFVAGIVFGGQHVKADFTFGEPVNLELVIPIIDAADEDIVSLSSDGLEMYIESFRSGGQGDLDIWVLRRNSIEGDWGLPNNLGPAVNSPNLESGASISIDGLTLLFTSNRAGGHGHEDIYITTRSTTTDPWDQAVNMGPNINSSSHDNYPCMSSDGLELYFSSMRPGGFGLADLWFTTRATTEDPWGKPENLGPMINSTHADMDPHLSPDGLILLFSGHPNDSSHLPGGYGGADIWMTRRQTLMEPWQAPVNLGPQVNGSKHGFIPRISPDGSTLYFVTKSGSTWENWFSSIIPIVDFNGDRIVDADDMCIMVDNWGTDNSLCDIGPMPWGDGIVDVEDLKVLAEHLFEDVNDSTLVAHWPLDETEGMFAADSVGNGINDAFVVGGAAWQPDSGQIDGALELNGVDGCAIAGEVLNPADGNFSVVAWIKGGAPGQVVLSQTGASNWLTVDAEGNLMTELKCTGRSAGPLYCEAVITDGQWHRIGLVWDGSTRTLCVDGVAVAEDTPNGLVSSNGGLYIGCGKGMEPGTYFSGLIDDIRIYNRAVSP